MSETETISSQTIIRCQHCGQLTNAKNERAWVNMEERLAMAEKQRDELRNACEALLGFPTFAEQAAGSTTAFQVYTLAKVAIAACESPAPAAETKPQTRWYIYREPHNAVSIWKYPERLYISTRHPDDWWEAFDAEHHSCHTPISEADAIAEMATWPRE